MSAGARWWRGRSLLAVAAFVVVAGCGDDDAATPGFAANESAADATYSYTIPQGAGEALDAGTPLEILPGTLEAQVGETIRIENLDDRGHNVGPWFVGAGETVTQSFTSAGTFEGVCTVHPSGELILIVE
ncbi:MAG: hypothetical protein AAGD33_22720 [Actinomycetota bacterium]